MYTINVTVETRSRQGAIVLFLLDILLVKRAGGFIISTLESYLSLGMFFFIETKFPYANTPPVSSAFSSPPVDMFEELFDHQPVSPSVSLETQPPPSTTPEPSSPTPHTSTVDAIPAPTSEQKTTQHEVESPQISAQLSGSSEDEDTVFESDDTAVFIMLLRNQNQQMKL